MMRRRTVLLGLGLLIAAAAGGTAMAADGSVYDYTLPGIDGTPLPLAQFRGKALLIVNTASECGFTPQYEGLQKLYETYKEKGLVILGVPSNDFGGQEPGSAQEIVQFCKLNYGVTFPLAAKTKVKGEGADPLYVWLTGLGGAPKWNFHKYLFASDGRFVSVFPSADEPMGPKITGAVTAALPK
jgi:glutathione peroxidase